MSETHLDLLVYRDFLIVYDFCQDDRLCLIHIISNFLYNASGQPNNNTLTYVMLQRSTYIEIQDYPCTGEPTKSLGCVDNRTRSIKVKSYCII